MEHSFPLYYLIELPVSTLHQQATYDQQVSLSTTPVCTLALKVATHAMMISEKLVKDYR